MSRADELRALLARVEEAETGNRDLEADIYQALGCSTVYCGHLADWYYRWAADRGEYCLMPSPLSSVDSAFDLIRKVLPDAYLDMDGTLGKANWCVTIRIGDHDAGEAWTRPAPALALIAALLSALIAKEGEDGR